MANALGTVMLHIRKWAAAGCARTDRELLEGFSASGDEVAFTALVARHGPMVLRVCRRVLRHEQDAEDAFQAAFLVLARSTASIRKPEALADWLHGVAYRTAMKAKRSAARRRNHETNLIAMVPKPASSPTWDDVQAVLDEEIQRLAEPFRSVFVLCVLEGETRPEAAAALKVKEGTVSSRLTRARRQLQKQLGRRGIQLPALLAALSCADSGVIASVPALLAQTAVGYGLLVAAGKSAAGQIPSHIAALAAGVTRAMLLKKATIATAVLITALLCGGATVLTYQTLAAKEKEAPAGEQSAAPATTKSGKPPAGVLQAGKDDDDKDATTYSGRVLGPDQKGVAGAEVYYHFITHEDEPIPVRTTTDGQGRFSFTLSRKDVPLSAQTRLSDPLKRGQIVIKARGYTIAWLLVMKSATDLTLHLAEDASPIQGRILDLEGKPLAGLRVSILSAWASESGDLSGFLKALRSGDTLYSSTFHHLPNYLGNEIFGRNVARLLPSAITGGDGRFRLPGFAKEQLIEMRIEGPSIETQNLHVLTGTRPSGTESLLTPAFMNDPGMPGPPQRAFVRWNGFDHAAPPGQVVTGTVRDEATKAPIPGATVESYMLAGSNLAENTIYRTVADTAGRFRFTGLPRGKGNEVRVRPPQDLPYLPVVREVPPWKASTDTVLDAVLQRGIWVDVTAKDKATGKPVAGGVGYFVLPELPSRNPMFDRPFADAYSDFMPTRADGTVRFAALPRRAIVAFRTDVDNYPIPPETATIELPGTMPAVNYHAFMSICPKTDDKMVKVEFILDRGGVAKGKLAGPDGQPVTGALATGLRDDWFWDSQGPLKTEEFTALGLHRPRLLCFVHEEMKLAGRVVLPRKEKGPLTVSLMPWGAVSGRLLDAAGKPIKNATLQFTEVPRRQSGEAMSLDTGHYVVFRSAYKPHPEPHADEEGRFHVDRLVPGLKYNLALFDAAGAMSPDQVKWLGLAFSNLVLQSGETKDLGDVRLQAFPKEKAK